MSSLESLVSQALDDIQQQFCDIDKISETNTERVLRTFQKHRVSEACFAGTTGYGYGDRGRDTLDAVFAEVFGAEKALVRIGFSSGTHAICAALFGALKPGDVLISATGTPYDTLKTAIGINGNQRGNLKEWGVEYREYPLDIHGNPDINTIYAAVLDKKVSAVFVQRSRGYSEREALNVASIAQIAEAVHAANERAVVIVDNCYGEFVEPLEPTAAGADVIAGSLIKNPGGGLAPTGGYVAGREDLVEGAAARLTAPGIGGEIGATLGVNRLLFQGLFMAPHAVAQALKTAVFSARLFELMGYETSPKYNGARSDIIQMVKTKSPEALRHICEGLQSGSPVDSFVKPEPWDMPGYDCKIIMANGAFVQGSSIELSADAPLREPFNVFIQGGVTFEAGKFGVISAAKKLLEYTENNE